MTALTVKDIERARPAFGALVVLDDGTEVVFVRVFDSPNCERCVLQVPAPNFGTDCAKVWCGMAAFNSGEYIPKMKYLELKLTGEIT